MVRGRTLVLGELGKIGEMGGELFLSNKLFLEFLFFLFSLKKLKKLFSILFLLFSLKNEQSDADMSIPGVLVIESLGDQKQG